MNAENPIHESEAVRRSVPGRHITSLDLSTIVFFSLSAFILFYNLGGYYLRDWDEAWYILMAEKAIHENNYMFLKFRNEVFWDKSPFSVYPMILSFKIFGVNEVSARLPSAFFGMGLLAHLWQLARRAHGRSS